MWCPGRLRAVLVVLLLGGVLPWPGGTASAQCAAPWLYVGDRERMGRLRFINGLATATRYGFMGPTGTNAAGWTGWTDALEVSGNTFSDAAWAFQVNLPSNTYVTRAELDLLAAAR